MAILYDTPLSKVPVEFVPTKKLTRVQILELKFGPEGWLNEEEKKLFFGILVLRQKVLSFEKEELGMLKK